MEEIQEFLHILAGRGITLKADGEQLHCFGPVGSLTDELKRELGERKRHLITLLTEGNALAAGSSRLAAASSADARPLPASSANSLRTAEPLLDLGAEAVLDPSIEPSAALEAVDFTQAREVLLTGASGFLGAYLLHGLMAQTQATVHCLVRCRSDQDGLDRLRGNLSKYRLWNEDFASRIRPVPGDLTQPLLGLDEARFQSLSARIDTVFHNGAYVNFVAPYAALKPSNVVGTAEVIRLASTTRRKPLHLVSSVAVIPETTDTATTVLETDPLDDWRRLVGGYPQSKWVAERLVSIAGNRGLPVRIYRPGFVGGDSVTGIYNTDDFVPRVLKGCIQLRLAPETRATIGMVPVDYVGTAIVHLSRQPSLPSNVFHLVPRVISVADMILAVRSSGYELSVVPYAEWHQALLRDARSSSENALYPLLPLFTEEVPFERTPVIDCRHALDALNAAQIPCPPVDADLISRYLTYFRSSGFLTA